jgi:hypothetical protein
MNLIDPACEPPEDKEDMLDSWLSKEEWSVAEAIQIFAGIDPGASRESRTREIFVFESVVQLNGYETPVLDDNGNLVCTCYDYMCAYCEGAKEALLAYSRKCKEIASLLGKRYEHQTSDSPEEWIERALSRNIEIPWFRWAKKRKLFFQLGSRGIALNMRQANGIAEKPIPTKERSVLSVIIAALCDHGDIKYQVRGAAQRIMKMTDDIGAHLDDGNILNVLKKIPIGTQEKLLSTKQINSRLIIIAALCEYSNIKHQNPEAAKLIMELTDEIGEHVDDGIILTALKKIPDALLKKIPDALITRTK